MMRTGLFRAPILVLLVSASTCMKAQLPPSFPKLMIYSNGPVAPGNFIGSLGVKGTTTNNFNVVLDNSGTPMYETPFTNLWRAVTPCGLIAESGNNGWLLKDETFTVVDTFPNGDGHDFKLLPNGHALILGNEDWPVDLSQVVPGGRPDAVLKSLVFWEVDAHKQILFQWRARDHLALTDSLDFMNLASVDWTHVNALTLDPLDNNYLISLRGFCQILKISRTTGEVIWRLGGKSNDFTFVGEHPENVPYYFIGQHNVHRLANGDILFFDNGSLQNQGPLSDRGYSRAVEYHLDETNMIATLVWEYRHTPDLLTPTEGMVKRFSNGNTYVGWVSAAQRGIAPVFTEVDASNQVVFELSITNFKSQSLLTKQVWNSPDLVHADTLQDIVVDQPYQATNAGVTVTVKSLSGSGSHLIVSKHDDAARFPLFAGKEPQVLVPRVTLEGPNIDAVAMDLSFDLPPDNYAFDTPLYPDPASLTVYQRPAAGEGLFVPLATVYDPGAQKLKVSTSQLGEFIFTYPDLLEVPLAPILYGQATQASVDQEQPVLLQWTPQGFARSYHLQVSMDFEFTSLAVDESSLTNMAYTLSSVQAGTNYYWRVSVSNAGGTSDWATASFATVPPLMHVSVPNGGEAWQRGVQYFIRWDANIAENVVIDLYKGGSFLQSIATNANNSVYYWQAGLKLVPASDYSIVVRSATNSAVSGMSAQTFSIIDAPLLGAGSITWPPEAQLQLTLRVPGAAQATVLGSTNLSDWEVLRIVPLTNGSAVFTDATATNFPQRFYRLSVP
jgi:hypothetical protein